MRKMTRMFSRPVVLSPSRIWSASCRTVFFGPETISGNNGRPHKKKHKFPASGYLPPFVLHVQNGRQNGEFMLDGGELCLNGKILLGPSDFVQRFDYRQITVDLNYMNELEIRVSGRSALFALTVSVEGINRWNYQGFLPLMRRD